MGAMLNFKDFLTALRLSTQSYGFTQQQVGFQMDTVARRAEALRQECIKLITANGGLSGAMKGVLNVATGFLQFLDRFGVQNLVLLVSINALALNVDRISNAFNRAKEAVASFIKNLASAANNMSVKNFGKNLAQGVLGAIAVIVDCIVVIQQLTDETANVTNAINSTTQAIEAEQEVMERQQQFVEQVPLLAEAYQELSEQIQQTSEDDEKRNELLEEQSEINDMLIQGIGEEDAAMVEASGNETDAIDTVRQHAKERYNEHQNNIRNMRENLRNYTREALDLSEKRRDQLKAEGNSWFGVAWSIASLGKPLRGVAYLTEEVLW